MLQVFHMDVLKVDLVLQLVFQMHVSCVSSVFRRMLQVLHLDVSKIDWVLHLPSFLLPRLSVSSSFQHRAGHPPPPRPLLDAGNVRGQRGPRMGA